VTNDEAKAQLEDMRKLVVGTSYVPALSLALWLLEREHLVQTLIFEASRIYPGGVVGAYDALEAWEKLHPRPGS
jgi:hypothetical protein